MAHEPKSRIRISRIVILSQDSAEVEFQGHLAGISGKVELTVPINLKHYARTQDLSQIRQIARSELLKRLTEWANQINTEIQRPSMVE